MRAAAELPPGHGAACETDGVETYPERDMKIALCLQSSMVAKQTAVREMGIGEDLTFTLFGWDAEKMAVISTMAKQFMAEDPDDRLQRVAIAATIQRKGWGCDAFSFVAEAYCSLDAGKTAGKPLSKAFTEPDSPVYECLTVTHVDEEGITVATQPYRIHVGKRVEWLRPLVNEQASGLRDAKYPALLWQVLRMDIEKAPYESDTFYQVLAEGLESDGFFTQWTFD